MTKKALKTWHLWAMVGVLALLFVDIADGWLNFPVRLGIVRVALLFGEQGWARLIA
jgi:hypothetical protein